MTITPKSSQRIRKERQREREQIIARANWLNSLMGFCCFCSNDCARLLYPCTRLHYLFTPGHFPSTNQTFFPVLPIRNVSITWLSGEQIRATFILTKPTIWVLNQRNGELCCFSHTVAFTTRSSSSELEVVLPNASQPQQIKWKSIVDQWKNSKNHYNSSNNNLLVQPSHDNDMAYNLCIEVTPNAWTCDAARNVCVCATTDDHDPCSKFKSKASIQSVKAISNTSLMH